MKSGYKIFWTENANYELEKTVEYLEQNFSKKQLESLFQRIDSILSLISQNPKLFPISNKKGIHRVTILKYNTMYYKVQDSNIEILSFLSNRQNPDKRKI